MIRMCVCESDLKLTRLVKRNSTTSTICERHPTSIGVRTQQAESQIGFPAIIELVQQAGDTATEAHRLGHGGLVTNPCVTGAPRPWLRRRPPSGRLRRAEPPTSPPRRTKATEAPASRGMLRTSVRNARRANGKRLYRGSNDSLGWLSTATISGLAPTTPIDITGAVAALAVTGAQRAPNSRRPLAPSAFSAASQPERRWGTWRRPAATG